MILAYRKTFSVATQNVNLTVDVDDSACGKVHDPNLLRRLNNLKTSGLTVPVNLIYTYSAALFKEHGQASGPDQLAQALQCFNTWTISSALDATSGLRKLITIPPASDANQKLGTELLGVGVGLLVATRLYQIPLIEWETTRGNGTFDHVATSTNGGDIFVEARGRMNRKNWPKAVAQSNDKLITLSPRCFETACAVIFAPRSKNVAQRTKDILIIDPPGDGNKTTDPFRRLRRIVKHYIPILERTQPNTPGQNFVRRLKEIVEGSEEIFAAYLQNGDPGLRYDERALTRPWRTSVRFGGEVFCGTYFKNTAYPIPSRNYTPIPEFGYMFVGIWKRIIEALRDGRIPFIQEVTIEPEEFHYEGKIFALQEDGVALAWAPSEDMIGVGMFDGMAPIIDSGRSSTQSNGSSGQ